MNDYVNPNEGIRICEEIMAQLDELDRNDRNDQIQWIETEVQDNNDDEDKT